MDKTRKKAGLTVWLRKLGIWGFLFFLAKGLVWLLLAYFAVK